MHCRIIMDFYQNQEILLDPAFSKNEMNFIHGKGLNDFIESIPIEGNEDIYYKGQESNESVNSKFLKLCQTTNGWIHFQNGTSFGVKKGKINEIKLTNNSLGKLSKLISKDVEARIGKPSKIEHDIITYVFDPVDEGDIYHYKKTGISIQFDPDSKRIKEIRIK